MTIADIHKTDDVDLRAIGIDELAYLRHGEMDGTHGYVICAADGSVIGFAPSREQAIAAIMQNDMELARIH